MFWKPNAGSGVPIYLQLIEQVKHAIEIGALRAGEQLPGIRKVAEDLVVNPNTVAKAYRELEHDGVIELRQGFGAFVTRNGTAGESRERRRIQNAQTILRAAVERMATLGLDEPQMRRLFETEMMQLGHPAEKEE